MLPVFYLALQVFLRTKGIVQLLHLCLLPVNLVFSSSREKVDRQEGNIQHTAGWVQLGLTFLDPD